LLGADRIGRTVLEETHRPDAFRMEPFAWDFGHPEPEMDDGMNGAVRGCVPLRRFRKRKRATMLLENNRPAHVRAAEVRAGLAVEGTTMRQEGPFPLSGNWWDERAWAWVEWDVEIENGVIARCHCDQTGWAIDGIYD